MMAATMVCIGANWVRCSVVVQAGGGGSKGWPSTGTHLHVAAFVSDTQGFMPYQSAADDTSGSPRKQSMRRMWHKWLPEIAKDLRLTLAQHKEMQNAENQYAALRILVACSERNPGVDYCQVRPIPRPSGGISTISYPCGPVLCVVGSAGQGSYTSTRRPSHALAVLSCRCLVGGAQ